MPPKPKKRTPATRRSRRLRHLGGSSSLFGPATTLPSAEVNAEQPAAASSSSTLASKQSISAQGETPATNKGEEPTAGPEGPPPDGNEEELIRIWLTYWDVDAKKGHLPPPIGFNDEELRKWNSGPVGCTYAPESHLSKHMRHLIECVDCFHVFLWVHNKTGESDVWGRLDEDTQNQLLTWAPQARAHLNDQFDYGRFVAAWMWRMLYENLFSPQAINKWFGDAWTAFGKLHDILSPRVQNVDDEFTRGFHMARQRYVRMLYSIHGIHVDAAELKQKLIKPFEPLLNLPELPICAVIDPIVELAIDLDIGLLGSRISWEVIMQDTDSGKLYGFPFTLDPDPKESESIAHKAGPRMNLHSEVDTSALRAEELEGLTVNYISRPMFRRYGQSLGCCGLPGALGAGDVASYMDFDQFEIDYQLLVEVEFPPSLRAKVKYPWSD